MRIDVRKQDVVWIVMRREDAYNYHIQGICVDTEDCTAEEIAISMCEDETWFIGPLSVNVAYPKEAFEWKGCYYPLRHEGPKKSSAAPSAAAVKRARKGCVRQADKVDLRPLRARTSKATSNERVRRTVKAKK